MFKHIVGKSIQSIVVIAVLAMSVVVFATDKAENNISHYGLLPGHIRYQILTDTMQRMASEGAVDSQAKVAHYGLLPGHIRYQILTDTMQRMASEGKHQWPIPSPEKNGVATDPSALDSESCDSC